MIKLLSTVPELSGYSWRKVFGLWNSTIQSGPSSLCISIMTDASATSSMGSLTRYQTCINLHCKKKNCFSRFLCGGWLCCRVVIRGQRIVQGQSSGPAAWCAVCKMLNKRYIFVVIRGSSSPHPGTTCWLSWPGNANWIQCGS